MGGMGPFRYRLTSESQLSGTGRVIEPATRLSTVCFECKAMSMQSPLVWETQWSTLDPFAGLLTAASGMRQSPFERRGRSGP